MNNAEIIKLLRERADAEDAEAGLGPMAPTRRYAARVLRKAADAISARGPDSVTEAEIAPRCCEAFSARPGCETCGWPMAHHPRWASIENAAQGVPEWFAEKRVVDAAMARYETSEAYRHRETPDEISAACLALLDARTQEWRPGSPQAYRDSNRDFARALVREAIATVYPEDTTDEEADAIIDDVLKKRGKVWATT